MTDTLYSDEELEKAHAIGRAEGLQEGHEQGYREAKVAGAGREEGKAQGFKQGYDEAREAFRERAKAILESPAAKGRETAAMHLMMETDLSADDAIAALATMPSKSAIGARAATTVFSPDPTTFQ